MVPIAALWFPILLSAVVVFIASSIIHMVIGYHRSDFGKLPREDEAIAALRPLDIPPGEYVLPHASGPSEMKTPEFIEKAEKGPVAFLTVMPSAVPGIALNLFLWFLFCAVVSFFAAYVAGRALEPGAYYLSVFRFVGATAFVGYSVALWQNSIWYHRAWSTTIKSTIDGLIYALLSAGVFGWLWPA